MRRRQFVTTLGAATVGGVSLASTASAASAAEEEEYPVHLERGTTFSYAESDGGNTEDEMIRGGKSFIHAPLPDDGEFFLFQYTYGLGAFDDVVMVLSPEEEPRCVVCVDGTTYGDAVNAGMTERLCGLTAQELYTEPLYEARETGVVDAVQFSQRRLCRFASTLTPFYEFEPYAPTE